jgi:hypothetical protein
MAPFGMAQVVNYRLPHTVIRTVAFAAGSVWTTTTVLPLMYHTMLATPAAALDTLTVALSMLLSPLHVNVPPVLVLTATLL